MPENITELSALAIVSIFLIKEMFGYLKAKKNEGGLDKTNKEMLNEMRLMNSNHLTDICSSVRNGDDRIVDAINEGNTKIIELLGRIDGRLSK
jgi:hypothetical protein